MKCVIALMQHETNTFAPGSTGMTDFARIFDLHMPPVGARAINAVKGVDLAMNAFIDLARELEWEIEVPVAAWAEPGGTVEDAAFDALSDQICDAVADGCDVIMLDLHGAMTTERYPDAEAELLRRIRLVAPHTPIAVALDFHANLSAEFYEHATVVTGYRTYPHIDMYETGERAARALVQVLADSTRYELVSASMPMLTHMNRQSPAMEPMKSIMDRAIRAEASGEVLTASVFGGFPLADAPQTALSITVMGTKDGTAHHDLLDELKIMAWQRRADFVFTPEPLEKTLAYAGTLTDGPIILADHGDNSGAGGPHDNMTVLKAALEMGLTDIAVAPVPDPEAVEFMWQAGEGNEVEISLGGKSPSPELSIPAEPLVLRGRVKTLTDGTFTITAPMMTGMTFSIGRTAVLETDQAEIIVSEDRTEPFDIGFFTHAGIDPHTKRYLLLKSRQHFRAGFEDLAKHILMVAGPGVCSSDYSQFPFRKLQRPIYPLDLDMKY